MTILTDKRIKITNAQFEQLEFLANQVRSDPSKALEYHAYKASLCAEIGIVGTQ